MSVVEFLYALCVILLSIYGFNNLVLTWLYLRHRHDPIPEPPSPAEWPHVTVQLPIYNELHTVERLVKAAAGLDYPRDRLEIQVTDAAKWRDHILQYFQQYSKMPISQKTTQ